MDVLERVAEQLRREGGLLAAAVVTTSADGDDRLGRRAAGDRRDSRHQDDYATLVETIFEGYLQHYGAGRILRPADPELELLAGDRLYALGLSRLAELGDLEAIAILADVISDCARAHAEGREADAATIWEKGADAIAQAAASHPLEPAAR